MCPWYTPFPFWSQSIAPYPVLLVIWTTCRFLRRQVGGSGIPVSLKIVPQFAVIHMAKGFSIVNEAWVDVFRNSLAFSMIQQMLAVWFLVPLPFFKSSWSIWKFSVHVLLKPGLENFEHLFASMWDKCNCAVVWAFFGIAFLHDWNETWPFPVLWPLLSFPNVLPYWVQHLNGIIV